MPSEQEPHRLATASFRHFRGFERLDADLAPHAFVVGPNSAGKSTIIEAISLVASCLERARRQRANVPVRLDGGRWSGMYLPSSSDEDDEGQDPIRFDFGRSEATATIKWATGAFVRVVWPHEDTELDPYFVLVGPEGTQVRPADVATFFGRIAVVPVLTPLERVEELRNATYIRKHANGRLASRHFRNHMRLMEQEGTLASFVSFAEEWLPEIEVEDVLFEASANRLGVFYREPESRVPKELAWAGDGMQIWVQLLWHIWRAQEIEVDTIVLDEPEVYLHPDLQRRLVRLLRSTGAQIVLASHSADVLAEAPADGVLWVDRRRNHARKAKNPESLAALRASLGSTYNLQLARANRAQLVVATDAEDPRVLRAMARAVGAMRLANDDAVAILKLRNPTEWGPDRLGNELKELLPSDVPSVVLLQQGQQPVDATHDLMQRAGFGLSDYRLFPMAQLDNALLRPRPIAQATGAAIEAVLDRLSSTIRSLHAQSKAAFIGNAVKIYSGEEASSVALRARVAFDSAWPSEGAAARLVSASAVLLELNAWVAQEGYRLLEAVDVARALRPSELDGDIYDLLLEVDGLASGIQPKCGWPTSP